MSEKNNPPSTPEDILVVDDTPDSLRLLTDLLAKHGYRIRPASDGALALKSVAARTPDLILLDISMPDMDGYEACRRLKADGKNSRIPIIFISAFGDTRQKVKGFEAGCRGANKTGHCAVKTGQVCGQNRTGAPQGGTRSTRRKGSG